MGSVHGKTEKTRLSLYKLIAAEPPFPEIEDRIDLIDTVQDMGWGVSTGMGSAPLSAQEIKAWCELMGDDLSPWEFRVIRKMSGAYVSGMSRETAPYQPLSVKMALASAGMVEG